MPYIEKQDMRDAVEANLKASPPGYVWDVNGKINMVICPDDRAEQTYSSNTNSKGARIKYSKLSYGINGGVWDNTSLTYPQAAFDWEQNGVAETRLRGSSDPPLKFQNMTKGRVRDGASNTILFGENVDLEEWSDAASEIHVAILWDDRFNDDATFAGTQLLNKYPPNANSPDTKPDTLLNLYAQGQNVGIAYARPLSNHPTGFMLAFCDGHVKFVSEAIDRLVYFRLMTSTGKNYLPAGTPQANVGNPQLVQQIRQLQMQPLSDGDY
jgi:prepilin-type processing-associated H-X9-DG protein